MLPLRIPLVMPSKPVLWERYLHRPTLFTLPSWAVKLIFGEGSVVMLDSKEAIPRVLATEGFEFYYPTFESAFKEIAASV